MRILTPETDEIGRELRFAPRVEADLIYSTGEAYDSAALTLSLTG